MVIYDLYCNCGYQTEAWFASLEDYEMQAKRGLIECPNCHSVTMHKKVSAPHVHKSNQTTEAQPKPKNVKENQAKQTLLDSIIKHLPHDHDKHLSKALSPKKPIADHTKPSDDIAQHIHEIINVLVDFTLTHSEDVGQDFPQLARQMKAQEIPQRFIRGEASFDEVKALSEEGIDCLPLPIPTKNKWN